MPNDQETPLLQKHLSRASDLDADFDKYAKTHNVDFDELHATQSQPDTTYGKLLQVAVNLSQSSGAKKRIG